MKGKYWCALIGALVLLAMAGCVQTTAMGGGTEIPKEMETLADTIKETETESEKVTWIANSRECPSWDAMQRSWSVKGDTIYMVKTEWLPSGGSRHVIVSLDKEGNVIREMPVNMVWDGWMPCEGISVEEDDSFVLVAEAPDSLNEGESKRKVSYVKVDRDGNVLLDQEIHEPPTISESAEESAVECPYYLQPGIWEEFIAVDRVGVVEFTPGEEPMYLLKFADYGLERMNIHGLQVQGEDILLMEQKGTDVPVLWRFQKE